MTSLLQTSLNGHLPAPPEKRILIINTPLSLPYFPAASCQTNEICMNKQLRKSSLFDVYNLRAVSIV